MNQKELSLPIDDQLAFFLPLLSDYCQKLSSVLSRSQKKDLLNAEWWIIFDPTKAGKLLNYHLLKEHWETLRHYFRKTQKLFFFIEEKKQGLVESAFKIWVFFSPATAASYFQSQPDKPKDFQAHRIQPLPFPDLTPSLLDRMEQTLTIDLSHVSQVMEKILDTIDLADHFLTDQDLSRFDLQLKNRLLLPLGNEIEQLQKDIGNTTLSASLVKRRLLAVFKLSWRYFRAHNELETRYFKKLISDDPDQRLKGLKLAAKKIADYSSEFRKNPT